LFLLVPAKLVVRKTGFCTSQMTGWVGYGIVEFNGVFNVLKLSRNLEERKKKETSHSTHYRSFRRRVGWKDRLRSDL